MSEMIKRDLFELDPPAKRLEYGAVPLDPLLAVYPGTADKYRVASFEHIESKLDAAVRRASENNWAPQEDSDKLKSLLDISLYSSHNERMMRNPNSYHLKEVVNTKLVDLAIAGLATPAQLLELLKANPTLDSIELAKLSHPLNFGGPNQVSRESEYGDPEAMSMDDAIGNILLSIPEDKTCLAEQPTRYKLKTHGMNHPMQYPALTMLRKTPIANIYGDDDIVQVAKRESFLVRGDTYADFNGQGDYFSRKVRTVNDKNTQYIEDAIENKLRSVSSLDNMSFTNYWLQPIATSYYAKRIK